MEIRRLSFSYPNGHPALIEVDLVIENGESVALLGANGAGKTTLALHLNGLLSGNGRVNVLGMAVEPPNLRAIRQRVGVVFQDPEDQLFMNSVGEDVAFGPRNMRLSPEEVTRRVRESLRTVELEGFEGTSPHHLSFGQKRRAALAGVLAMRPELLVLDEPAANLDPVARRRLAELLQALPCTRVLLTHDLPLALQTCGRAVILNRGRVAADGPAARILGDQSLLESNGLEWPFGFRHPALPE